jgi:hypothetical protein
MRWRPIFGHQQPSPQAGELLPHARCGQEPGASDWSPSTSTAQAGKTGARSSPRHLTPCRPPAAALTGPAARGGESPKAWKRWESGEVMPGEFYRPVIAATFGTVSTRSSRVRPWRRGRPGRPAGRGPHDRLAMTQYREWSSTPVTILTSRPSARNALAVLKARRPLTLPRAHHRGDPLRGIVWVFMPRWCPATRRAPRGAPRR